MLFVHNPLSRAAGPVLLVGALLLLGGCEPELGGWCGDSDFVNERVPQRPGEDNLAVNLSFEACGDGACASTNGSRPYCTQRCEVAAECRGAPGETWVCEPLIYFSRYGCEDWTPENDCIGSTRFIKYCQTTRATITERDTQYNREWPSPDDGITPMTDGGT